jgi:hypothetical protein
MEKEWSEDSAADEWLPRPYSSGFDALPAGEIFSLLRITILLDTARACSC